VTDECSGALHRGWSRPGSLPQRSLRAVLMHDSDDGLALSTHLQSMTYENLLLEISE
jgi:hypothetical protein